MCMDTGQKAKKQKQNNAGSAIVTVLVVVTFVTILATVLLYISGMNFQMKVADYRTKESFYQAEIPAEELRAQLVKDVEFAFAQAYTAAASEYAGLSSEGNREANYRQRFCEEFDRIWRQRCGLVPGSSTEYDWSHGITSVLLTPATGSTWGVDEDGRSVLLSAATDGYWILDAAGTALDVSKGVSDGQIVLQGVTLIYDSPSRYSSIISTDYCITIPPINWSETYEPEGAPTGPGAPGESPAPAATPEPLYFDGNYSGCVNYMNWTKQ